MTADVHVPPAAKASPAPELEASPCPNGCPPGDEHLVAGRDRLHAVPGRFSVVRCKTCGLMRTHPRPSPAAMAAFYPDDYHVYGEAPKRGGGVPPKGPLRRLGRRAINFQADDLPLSPPGALLEVGCASGHFLAELERRGWEVEGVEFSASASATARQAGFTVRTGSLETVEEPERQYDLVVMRMVLEHLHDPIAGLRRLHSWTKPGGWLMASVPDAGNFEFDWFGASWYALDLPRHLYHFTPDTIGPVLERGGWRLQKVLHQRDFANVVASAGYLLQDHGLWPDLAGRLARFPQNQQMWEKLALYPLTLGLSAIQQTGRMTIWAQRIDPS